MDQKKRQAALDNISEEDLKKVEAYQAKLSNSFPVDNEWLILAEVAERYGWQAFLDVKNDARDSKGNLLVKTKELMTLLAASRKLDSRNLFKSAEASFIGAVSSTARKPASIFARLTKQIIKSTKADEE